MCLGPAGTGKTESVKALGHQLGRFVLVFNCDETFDFQASDFVFKSEILSPNLALLDLISVYFNHHRFFFQAMGRIFVGLCQVGAWGCFDEFNRLEERMLSAVSQQIQTIQLSLREGSTDLCKEGNKQVVLIEVYLFL